MHPFTGSREYLKLYSYGQTDGVDLFVLLSIIYQMTVITLENL